MDKLSANAARNHPIFYAGRFRDHLSQADLPEGSVLLGEWDVLPAQLTEIVEEPSILIILDLFSFPFEILSTVGPDVPLILVLPPGFDAGFLTTVFGKVAFERLDFFDRIATADSTVWEALRRRYGWAEGQSLGLQGGCLKESVRELGALFEAESETLTVFDNACCEVDRYWEGRDDALARSVPHRAICSMHHGLHFNKAIHRVQKAALEPQFAAARGSRSDDVPFDVLEVGAGVGRWGSSFDLARTRFSGVDISEGMVAAARANFSEARFDHLGPDLILPHDEENFDLVFTVNVLQHNPTPVKRTLLSEMWRVSKPGGRLVFLEDFVAGGWPARSTVYPMSVLKFVELLLEVTAGQVVLEHFESLRYAHDDVRRGGVLALSKLGVPKAW